MTGKFIVEETVTEKKTIELPLEECSKCGKCGVTTFDCGYSSFNVCGVTCNHCGRKISRSGDYTQREIIQHWNSVNGKLTDVKKIQILRKQLEDLGKTPLV